MNHLDQLEARSIYIIREAYARVHPMAMLWSIGKDSTAMLWLVKKAFFGRVPFPLVLLDTGMEMDEVYAFRDKLTKEWDLPTINHLCPPEEEMDQKVVQALSEHVGLLSDALILNAGVALFVTKRAPSIESGIAFAAHAHASGRGLSALERLRKS